MKLLIIILLLLLLVGCAASNKTTQPWVITATVSHVQPVKGGYEVYARLRSEVIKTVMVYLPDSVRPGKQINIQIFRRVK